MYPNKRQQVQDGRYRTSDLYYAAYLKVAGVQLIDTEREGHRVFFVFEHTPTIKDLKTEYFNRTSKVPALTYADEIRTMKSLTHMGSR
jgi:hypothetical protein